MILRFKRDISQGQAMGAQIGEREFWGGIALQGCVAEEIHQLALRPYR